MHDERNHRQAKPGVLIVVHDRNTRTLLAEALTLEGYSSRQATNGDEGLQLLQQATESCIVFLQLDPYEDMWDLMRMLHENSELHGKHRIIQMDIPAYVEEGRPLEPDDVLLIPFNIDQLLDVMARNQAALQATSSQ